VTAVTIALGGWVAAGLAGGAVMIGRRSLELRMQAVARACHELRGPLTSARLGLALGARAGELSSAQLRALDLELGRAALALDDLAAARPPLPQRPGHAEDVEVSELLADSVEAWRAAAAAARATLVVQWSGAPAHVRGDRLRLAQAAGNLIANAIEHGGGAIVVSGRGEPAWVRFEVIDDGPGLPVPLAELTRRARHGRSARGHGLATASAIVRDHGGRFAAAPAQRGHGLAIASAIAHDHGGRLAAAPSQRGARLVLELPALGRPGERVDRDAAPRFTA
jgi:signal transduction histidine kinase